MIERAGFLDIASMMPTTPLSFNFSLNNPIILIVIQHSYLDKHSHRLVFICRNFLI